MRIRFSYGAFLAAAVIAAGAPMAIAVAPPTGGTQTKTDDENSKQTAINTALFADGAHHWRKIRDDNRVIQPLADQPVYDARQIEGIVRNILLFQRANGGWPKDYDYLAVLTPEQSAAVAATRDRRDTSFDNHNIHAQVDYLARAYAALGHDAWREGCLRGLDFILAAQLPNGGFPQCYAPATVPPLAPVDEDAAKRDPAFVPTATGYAAHITFNDGVMIGNLNVLKDAADREPHWKWLDDDRRRRAQVAVSRGVECILKCQIKTDGGRTGWCQQHDASTYKAASARTFELASCCPQDTTEIVRFLMRLDQPEERVVRAVDDAVDWLRKVQLHGVRVKKVAAPVEVFLRHTADFDTVVIADEAAPPLWARHYEIGTDRPVFAGRDAVKRYSLAEIERERRTGTPWYGTWPTPLLENDYPNWRAKQR